MESRTLIKHRVPAEFRVGLFEQAAIHTRAVAVTEGQLF